MGKEECLCLMRGRGRYDDPNQELCLAPGVVVVTLRGRGRQENYDDEW